MDILYSATGSYAATCVLSTVFLLLYFFAIVNVIAATSRQCWAFARYALPCATTSTRALVDV